MNSVRDILEAIRALPRPDRLRLAEQLSEELGSEAPQGPPIEPPSESRLVMKNGFYVFTGSVEQAELDHRIDREEHLDHLARFAGAGRDRYIRSRGGHHCKGCRHLRSAGRGVGNAPEPKRLSCNGVGNAVRDTER